MLSCTTERLDQLMGATHEPDRVFHYCRSICRFHDLDAVCLTRESVLTLSTDLNKLADEIRLASPNYFLNVPTLLERVRVESKKPFPSGPRLSAPSLQKRAPVGSANMWVAAALSMRSGSLWAARSSFERFASDSAHTFAL